MLESEYQGKLIKKIEALLPGCIVTKNDANHIQGLPDLSVFYNNEYAWLEVKASEKSKERPNQRYYIENFSGIFGSFIYPENEREVLHALQQAFQH